MNAKPIGGINLFVSLMIITGYNVKKRFSSLSMKKTIFSLLIVGFILVYLISSFLTGFNFNLNPGKDNPCKVAYHKVGERSIILRIDDIQANYNKEVQIKMLDELKKRNLTASLGVIPLNLLEDKEISKYLLQHRCDFEIALHGYDNSDYEFDFIEYPEASEKLRKGLEIVNEIEPKILTFIPPNNEISDGAEKAILEDDIKIVSGGSWNTEYGFTISTYNWINHRLNNVSYILGNCKNTLADNKPCIIMIHPQDYTTDNKFDKEKYDEYLKLLDGVEKLDANIVNFRDIYYKDRIELN